MFEKKLKVLVIDDESDFRDMLAEVLQRHGFDVVTGENGKTGKFHTQLQHFDLILTDINMPFCDGVDVLQFVKERDTTPVILMTGNLSTDPQKALTEWKADGFLCKPFQIEELLKEIEKAILGESAGETNDQAA